jgi:hypothetical protein
VSEFGQVSLVAGRDKLSIHTSVFKLIVSSLKTKSWVIILPLAAGNTNADLLGAGVIHNIL